jgi:hypothetical protein
MQATPQTQPLRKPGRPVYWIIAATCIVVSALLCIAFFLHDFYVGSASLAPGTEIRPMGLAAVLGLSGTYSILLGGGFAIAGFVVSLKQRRWLLALLALAIIASSWSPWILGSWGFDYIVDLRHLVLEE